MESRRKGSSSLLPASQPDYLPARLHESLRGEFKDADQTAALFAAFLKHKAYNSGLVLKLLAVARAEAGESWEIRRLATLMLEHQVLKIPAGNSEAFDLLLTQLKLKPAEAKAGISPAVSPMVLKEGYSTTEPRGFIAELRGRLARLNRIHDRIGGRRTSPDALLDFIKLSQRDCKLTLARYLFRPEEVVRRILEQVRLSRGLADLNPSEPAHLGTELEKTLAEMPDFEVSIFRGLQAAGKVFWVSDVTSSEINSLVEYPIGTVVLTVKPPGSQLEFEIKRAGRRGANPFGVVHQRGQRMVPPSHRLDGGSMQAALRWEADLAAKFATVYRLAHNTTAPVSVSIARTSVYGIPADGGEARLLNYFTEPQTFGPGFRTMRAAMKQVIASFDVEQGAPTVATPGELGLTARFLMHVAPTQAILCGTSSFRLDRLAAYLSSNGAELYFGAGLKIAYSEQDARRFADEVLEEILGIYQPPDAEFREYGQYLAAAFAVLENRERADHNFQEAMRQIGMMWGTLFAIRGHSTGESFVARNVGLRSIWKAGQWQVNLTFMDHDSLHISDPSDGKHQWLGVMAELATDEIFICGLRDGDRQVVLGEVDCLERIYRVGPTVFAEGKAAFRRAMKSAYQRTQQAIDESPSLQKLFHPSFVKRLHDLDTVAAGYLKIRKDPQGITKWKEKMTPYLEANGYTSRQIEGHLAMVEKHADFLARYSFLY